MGEVAEGWRSLPLDDLVPVDRPICYGVLKPGDFFPDGVPLVRIVDIVNNEVVLADLHRISTSLDAEFQRSKLLGGEVLVSIQGTIGRVAVVPGELSGANISRTIARIAVNRSISPGFLSQWLRSQQGQIAMANSVLGTTRDSLNISVLRRIHLAVPPIAEQRRIVEILDTADEAIRSTERLIAKLVQAKKGLLHDLLERCVNGANGQRKARMVPLGDACDLQVGFAFRSEWFREDGEIRLLRGENAGYGVPNWADTRYLTKAKAQEFGSYLLEAGDIIIGMDRAFTKSGFKVSKIAAEDTPSLLVQRVGRFQPHGIIGSFLWCILNSETYQSQLALRQIGMDIPHLSKADILSPVIPMPEVVIQQRIAETFSACEQRERSESRYLAGLLAAKGGLMDDLLTGRTCVGASV